MHKKLYSLIFAVMAGVTNCQTDSEVTAKYQPVFFETEEAKKIDRIFEEWQQFEYNVQHDASPEVIALVKKLESNVVILHQEYCNFFATVLHNNAQLIIDHAENSPMIFEATYNDVVQFLERVNYVMPAFLLDQNERDLMQDQAPEVYAAYIKTKMDILFSLVDCISVACGDVENTSKAILDTDAFDAREIIAVLADDYSHMGELARQIILNLLQELKAILPQVRSQFHALLDQSVDVVDLTGCNGTVVWWFLGERIEQLGHMHSQGIQEFLSEIAKEKNVLKEKEFEAMQENVVIHVDTVEQMINLYNNIIQRSQELNEKLLTNLQHDLVLLEQGQ